MRPRSCDQASLDCAFMLRALRLARRGEGRVEPNPMVGCVIVKNGRIIGEGWHRRFGGLHAEIEALANCKSSAKGASVYVTLEPCCHFGKTPPCVDAIIEARIGEVIAAIRDPNPAVCGKGLRRLQAAGIAVRTGVEAAKAAALIAPFATRIILGRPYVIAKWAQDSHGGLTRPAGQSPWISSPPARRWGHRLRARVDAIVVGSGTVLRDDPLLTARDVPIRRRAIRVVLDSRLRTPIRSKLVATAADVPLIVLTSAAMSRSNKARRLRERHVEVLPCSRLGGGIHLQKALRMLAEHDVTNVMVEGGPSLLRSFLTAGMVDEIAMIVAPPATPTFRSRGLLDVLRTIEPFHSTITRIGPDRLMRMLLRDPLRLHGAERPHR